MAHFASILVLQPRQSLGYTAFKIRAVIGLRTTKLLFPHGACTRERVLGLMRRFCDRARAFGCEVYPRRNLSTASHKRRYRGDPVCPVYGVAALVPLSAERWTGRLVDPRA